MVRFDRWYILPGSPLSAYRALVDIPSFLVKAVTSAGMHRKLLLGLAAGLVLIALPSMYFLLFPPGKEMWEDPGLERILKTGVLQVVTRNSATTWYIGPAGDTGFEYELAEAFARHLGVQLEIVPVRRFSDILPMVARGEVDMAAAGITVMEDRRKLVRFGPVYQQLTEQVVCRRGGSCPKSPADLTGLDIEVIAGSTHAVALRDLAADFPGLTWKEISGVESEELMARVWNREIDVTVADSNELLVSRRYYPELTVAFDLSVERDFAWVFPPHADEALHEAVEDFFERIRQDGTLTELHERHYGGIRNMAMVDTPTFLRHVQERLPPLMPYFMEAAERFGMDWRLLAAIGYQESYWDPLAVSPTGVRGVMMLTRAVAGELGIEDRLDPRASILGGAEYFLWVRDRIPERVPEPDRTWFALASYNVGYGHLEDARIITQRLGGNPDRWPDLMDHLPKLSQSQWHEQTRYGYARGGEPVRYVQNIRGYHDLLVRVTDREGIRGEIESILVGPGEGDGSGLPYPAYEILPPGL